MPAVMPAEHTDALGKVNRGRPNRTHAVHRGPAMHKAWSAIPRSATLLHGTAYHWLTNNDTRHIMIGMKRTTTKQAAATATVIAYVRVSTEEQANEGVSLDAQQARIRAYCAMRDRPAYLAALEQLRTRHASPSQPHVKLGGVKVVLCHQVSRVVEEHLVIGLRVRSMCTTCETRS